MKKTITTLALALVTLLGTSAFIATYQTGIAGYSGAPTEATCNACHGGGSSAAAGTTISSVPSFTNSEFVPGNTYTITVSLSASGFTRFGFNSEILNDMMTNSGTIQSPKAGVKILAGGFGTNVTHTTPKLATGGVASFSFEWVAPMVDDTATIYAAGNAVNFNNSTTGDFPMVPERLQLKAQPVSNPVSMAEHKPNALVQMSVYPNPSANLATLSYVLLQAQPVSVELIDLYGKTIRSFVKESQDAGSHSELLNLQGISPGIYFVKLSGNTGKLSQKLITIL